MPPNSLNDLRVLKLPQFARAEGTVIPLEAPLVPFSIARVFTVTGPLEALRGCHAHRQCSQLLFCPAGSVEAVCDDGGNKKVLMLDGKSALLVPPGLWLELRWKTANAVLVVLCDYKFEEADYIRERDEYIAWRAEA